MPVCFPSQVGSVIAPPYGGVQALQAKANGTKQGCLAGPDTHLTYNLSRRFCISLGE